MTFHFDVPRGILTVNGNEYKLLELDGNIDNGEELSLIRENVAFQKAMTELIRLLIKKLSKIDLHTIKAV